MNRKENTSVSSRRVLTIWQVRDLRTGGRKYPRRTVPIFRRSSTNRRPCRGCPRAWSVLRLAAPRALQSTSVQKNRTSRHYSPCCRVWKAILRSQSGRPDASLPQIGAFVILLGVQRGVLKVRQKKTELFRKGLADLSRQGGVVPIGLLREAESHGRSFFARLPVRDSRAAIASSAVE